MPTATDADPRLTTIRGLLAKAEATTFPAEAEAFTAKATELMQRYAIDAALVWATNPGETGSPVEARIAIHRPFTAPKAVLVTVVAKAYGCHALRLGAGADGTEQMSIVGFESDVSLVETLVTSLFLQLTTAMTAPGAAPAGTATQVAGWRRSFIHGFTVAIDERLAEHRAAAAAAAEAAARADQASAGTSSDAPADVPSVALVLRDRAAAVESDFRRRYPRIRTSRISVGTSTAGRRAGSNAGRSADLGGRRLGGRRALGPSQ